MRELPNKTSGVVSVRPLDLRHPASGPGATSTSAISCQDASGKRAALKLLRFPTVRERTGLSRSTIWRLEQRGQFPRHHRIAPNVVAWIEEEVSAWILERTTVPAAQSA